MLDMTGKPLSNYTLDVVDEFAIHLAELSVQHFAKPSAAANLLVVSYPPSGTDPYCLAVTDAQTPCTFFMGMFEKVAEADYHTRLGTVFSLPRSPNEFMHLAQEANVKPKDFWNTYVMVLLVGGHRLVQLWNITWDQDGNPSGVKVLSKFSSGAGPINDWGHVNRHEKIGENEFRTRAAELKRGLKVHKIALPEVTVELAA